MANKYRIGVKLCRATIKLLLTTTALSVALLPIVLWGQNNTPLQCYYDDSGQLAKVVDPSGNVTTYTYDAVGNILQITRSTLTPGTLAILSFAPTGASVGDRVIIQGQGFSPNPGADVITFNGTPATLVSATSTLLVVIVPLGAATGPLTVTVGGSTVQIPNFVILPAVLVSPSNPSVPLGNTTKLTATETLGDGSSKDVTTAVIWSSSVPAVARIGNSPGAAGLVTSAARGITTITATVGSLAGSTTVTVGPPALVSLAVSPAAPSFSPGITVQFNATGVFTDGSTQDQTNAVIWTSSNLAVATVGSSTGVVTTGAAGTTTIMATLGSVSGSTTLTVIQASSASARFALVSNASDGTISVFAVDAATGQLRSMGYNSSLALQNLGSPSPPAIDPSGQFAYIAGGASAQGVFGFSIDANRGALTLIPGSPFGANALAVTVDPSGKFVLVTTMDNTVTAYTLGRGGVLTQAPGGPAPTGVFQQPDFVTVHPSGRFVYVLSGASISAFILDSASGALLPVVGSPFVTSVGLTSAAVDPSGRFLYVVGGGLGKVMAYTIDSTSGSLTPISGSPFVAGTGPIWMTVEPAGKFLYVVNASSNNISASGINPTTGALSPAAQSPFPVGLTPNSMTVDPSGKFAYVVNQGSTTLTTAGEDVVLYAIDQATGALTAAQSYRTRGLPASVALSKGAPLTFTPKFAYVVNNGDNSVSASTIDPVTGALKPAPNSPLATGNGPLSVTSDPAGKFVYVANGPAATISGYSVDPVTGAIVQMPGSPFLAGSGPASVAVDPSGSFAYVANQLSNNVSGFSIDSTSGFLSPLALSPYSAHIGPAAATVDPLGKFAYVANQSSNDVSIFTLDLLGRLSTISNPSPAGSSPVSVVVEPTGNFVYVANSGSNNVFVYSIADPLRGTLSPISGSPFQVGTNPSSLTVGVSGKFLYVANAGSNNVSAYAIDPVTGAPTALVNSPFPAGTTPSSVTVDISGKFLYVVNSGSNNVSVFSIDPATGSLTAVPNSPFPAGTRPMSIQTTGAIK